jgi:hypothetical protein
MILVDPKTRKPLGAIPGERVRVESVASHWAIERDENGIVVRMRWVGRPATNEASK